MAKGLRSSKKKVNKLALRHRVFGPVEDARKERLSTKLLELASKPKARIAEEEQEEEDMKVVNSDQESTEQKTKDTHTLATISGEDMEVDEPRNAAASALKKSGRVQKRGRMKARVSVVFPRYKKGKK